MGIYETVNSSEHHLSSDFCLLFPFHFVIVCVFSVLFIGCSVSESVMLGLREELFSRAQVQLPDLLQRGLGMVRETCWFLSLSSSQPCCLRVPSVLHHYLICITPGLALIFDLLLA